MMIDDLWIILFLIIWTGNKPVLVARLQSFLEAQQQGILDDDPLQDSKGKCALQLWR